MNWNLHRRLLGLMPGSPLDIGHVVGVGETECVVALRSGAQITARGTAAVGDYVYVRGGVIEGEAPVLPGADLYE